ncbi:MAG: hypothetical protein HOE80_00880 [Candidatus Magasanikbacteria bacterium]|jgi:hypothetical protein|nr:hypothetical protein [Candidatus Magasanikbacteria bacterium]
MTKRNIVFILALLIMTTTLSGCVSKEEKAMKQIEKQMHEISEIQEKVMSGEISADEAEKLMGKFGKETSQVQNREVDSFPSWAKKLGFEDVKGVEFVSGEEVIEKRDGFNAINLKYKGDYDTVMIQAEKLAKSANIPKSKVMDAASEMLAGLEGMLPPEAIAEMEEAQKGAIYTNFDIMSGSTEVIGGGNHQKAIIVGEDGSLEISIVDFVKQQESAGKQGLIMGNLEM